MKATLFWISDLFALFFPRTCYGCERALAGEEEHLCVHCWFHLPRTNFHDDPGNAVAVTFWGRIDVVSATAFVYYSKDGTVRKLLHQLKYKGKDCLGVWLGREFGRELVNYVSLKGIDLIVPVPLHPDKKKKRGYNQSEKIAEGMCMELHLEMCTDLLFRKSNTKTQTKKTRYDRWENVEDIFGVSGGSRFEGRHILMVDDVITTGATLEACGTLLKKINGVRVSLAAIAFTPR